MRTRFVCFLAFLGLSLLPALSAIPNVIHHQGRITDAAGVPLNGTKPITFTLYDKLDNPATAKWTQTRDVAIDKGFYTVILGDEPANPFPVDLFSIPLYLGVQVEAEPELTPRAMLCAVPYANTTINLALPYTGFATTNDDYGRPYAFKVSTTGNGAAIVGSGGAAGVRGTDAADGVQGYGTYDGVYGEGPTGVRGRSFGSDSSAKGVYGTSAMGTGVFGEGGLSGVEGTSLQPGGAGVKGTAEGPGAKGVYGTSLTGTGVYGSAPTGVMGEAAPSTSDSRGVYGASPNGTGVYGSGKTGVSGVTAVNNGVGVKGDTSGGGIDARGVYGASSSGVGVYGSGAVSGVHGAAPDGRGVYGEGAYGVQGDGTADGVLGRGPVGVAGLANVENGTGVWGQAPLGGVDSLGVHGSSEAGTGVLGEGATGVRGATNAVNGTGIRGEANSGGGSARGVYGSSTLGAGLYGDGAYGAKGYGTQCGVYGYSSSTSPVWYGVAGQGPRGVFGLSSMTDGQGVMGIANNGSLASGIYGESTNGFAGYFKGKVKVEGNLEVTGTVSKTGGTFRIDHPLDPEHKYLNHSFVESPERKNVYDGMVTLDSAGEATVTLPDWFQALNTDFRYQLTCVGGFAPVYICAEIEDNHFHIGGGSPGLKVSWQVTGTRKDAWALANPMLVEEDKPAR